MDKINFDEKNLIKKFLSEPLHLSQIWYTIDIHWWKKWKNYVNYDDDDDNLIIEYQPPGKIDNKDLMNGNEFNENVLSDYDYEIIPEHAWKYLTDKYGIVQHDDNIFQRCVIENNDKLIVEIVRLQIRISVYGDTTTGDGKVVNVQMSRCNKLSKLEEFILKEFNIPVGSVYQLLKELDNKTIFVIRANSDDYTLYSAGFSDKQTVYVDVCNSKGEFGFKESRSNYTNNGSIKGGASSASYEPGPLMIRGVPNRYGSNVSSSMTTNQNSELPSSYSIPITNKKGVCGLANLGNTCFMNSAIQCVSNVPPLTAYFLDGKRWSHDLNKVNPLGMSGRIATVYAKLICEIWSGHCSYAVPRDFKHEVAQFAPQFCGFSQHDSQELMMFLLDGLHEDLNRITNKPYVEQKNCANQPDKVVADQNWNYHLKRNDSIIVDYFHGQLKSKVVCPDCNFISVTFDPFACLSLPLSQQQLMSVFFVPLDPNKPILQFCSISIYKNSPLEQLKKVVLQEINFESDCDIRIVQIRKYQIINYNMNEKECLNNILNDDQIVFYELAPKQPDHVYIDINFKAPATTPQCNPSKTINQLPLFIQLPRQLNWNQLVQALHLIQVRFLINFNQSSTIGVNSSVTINSNNNKQITKQCNEDDTDSGCVVSPNDDNDFTMVNGTPIDGEDDTEGDDGMDRTNDDNVSNSNSSIDSGRITNTELINPYDNIFSISLVEIGSSSTNEHEMNPLSRTRYLKGTNERLVVEWSEDGWNRHYRDEKFKRISCVLNTKLPQPTIDDCLRQFLSEECLGSKDLWFCPRCKKDKAACKKLDIWRLPKVLVLHLKRFKAASYFGDKINTEINYPIRNLDLTEYMPSITNRLDYMYDLVAVSNHVGSLASGHYFCYAKNCLDNKWYKFDDSNTMEVDESSIITKTAYVLVYVSRNCDTSNAASCLVNKNGAGDNLQGSSYSLNDMDIDDIDSPE